MREYFVLLLLRVLLLSSTVDNCHPVGYTLQNFAS